MRIKEKEIKLIFFSLTINCAPTKTKICDQVEVIL